MHVQQQKYFFVRMPSDFCFVLTSKILAIVPLVHKYQNIKLCNRNDFKELIKRKF